MTKGGKGSSSEAPSLTKEQSELFATAVREHAIYLGLDPEKHKDLLYIAEEALSAPLPPGWEMDNSEDGRPYYYNSETGESAWDHPLDDKYRKIVLDKLAGRGERKKIEGNVGKNSKKDDRTETKGGSRATSDYDDDFEDLETSERSASSRTRDSKSKGRSSRDRERDESEHSSASRGSKGTKEKQGSASLDPRKTTAGKSTVLEDLDDDFDIPIEDQRPKRDRQKKDATDDDQRERTSSSKVKTGSLSDYSKLKRPNSPLKAIKSYDDDLDESDELDSPDILPVASLMKPSMTKKDDIKQTKTTKEDIDPDKRSKTSAEGRSTDSSPLDGQTKTGSMKVIQRQSQQSHSSNISGSNGHPEANIETEKPKITVKRVITKPAAVSLHDATPASPPLGSDNGTKAGSTPSQAHDPTPAITSALDAAQKETTPTGIAKSSPGKKQGGFGRNWESWMLAEDVKEMRQKELSVEAAQIAGEPQTKRKEAEDVARSTDEKRATERGKGEFIALPSTKEIGDPALTRRTEDTMTLLTSEVAVAGKRGEMMSQLLPAENSATSETIKEEDEVIKKEDKPSKDHELQLLRKEKSELQETATKLREELAMKTALLSESSKMKDQAMSDKTVKILTLESELSVSKEEEERLSTLLKAKDAEVSELRNKASTLDQRLMESVASEKKLQAQVVALKELKETLEKEVAKLQADVALGSHQTPSSLPLPPCKSCGSWEVKVAAMDSQLISEKARNETLIGQVKTASETISSLQVKLESVTCENSKSTAKEVADLKHEVHSLTQQLQQKSIELQGKEQRLDRALEDLKAAAINKVSEKGFEAQAMTLQAEVQSLRSLLVRRDRDVEGLESKLSEEMEKTRHAQNQLVSLRESADLVEVTAKSHRCKSEALDREMKRLQEEVSRLQSQLHEESLSASQERETVVRQNMQLQKKHTQLQLENTGLQEKVSALSGELEVLKDHGTTLGMELAKAKAGLDSAKRRAAEDAFRIEELDRHLCEEKQEKQKREKELQATILGLRTELQLQAERLSQDRREAEQKADLLSAEVRRALERLQEAEAAKKKEQVKNCEKEKELYDLRDEAEDLRRRLYAVEGSKLVEELRREKQELQQDLAVTRLQLRGLQDEVTKSNEAFNTEIARMEREVQIRVPEVAESAKRRTEDVWKARLDEEIKIRDERYEKLKRKLTSKLQAEELLKETRETEHRQLVKNLEAELSVARREKQSVEAALHFFQYQWQMLRWNSSQDSFPSLYAAPPPPSAFAPSVNYPGSPAPWLNVAANDAARVNPTQTLRPAQVHPFIPPSQEVSGIGQEASAKQGEKAEGIANRVSSPPMAEDDDIRVGEDTNRAELPTGMEREREGSLDNIENEITSKLLSSKLKTAENIDLKDRTDALLESLGVASEERSKPTRAFGVASLSIGEDCSYGRQEMGAVYENVVGLDRRLAGWRAKYGAVS